LGKELAGTWGSIIISPEVISTLAGIATTECFGIVGVVSSHIFSDGIAELLGKESLAKGVDIDLKSDVLKITVNVVIGYGINISVIAQNVMDNVKYIVERHTGLKVNHVTVNVQGVRLVG